MSNNIKGECLLNREGNILPFAYYNPETEGKLTWMCGEDAEGKITSVFCFDMGTHKEKQCEYVDDIEKARWMRDELVKHGWQKIKPPEVTFRFPGEKDPRTLNRKEKRAMKRYVEKQVEKTGLDEK